MNKEELRIAKVRFSQQRCMADKRNIEWKLTFEQWIDWWVATGHYHERGRGKGKYVMCRYGDKGPYELGNIYCDTHKGNLVLAHTGNTYSLGKTKSYPNRDFSGAKNPSARQVKILGNVYGCIKDAAQSLGIGYSLCKKRIRLQVPGYEYI
jgi:hypothetical protein